MFEQRTHFCTRCPVRQNAASRCDNRVVTRTQRGVGQTHVVETRLPYDDAEAHALMQEFDETRLCGKATAGVMTGLTELDDTRITDTAHQRLEIPIVRSEEHTSELQ